jgi:hypothetical protein
LLYKFIGEGLSFLSCEPEMKDIINSKLDINEKPKICTTEFNRVGFGSALLPTFNPKEYCYEYLQNKKSKIPRVRKFAKFPHGL